ncbi:MULTISPECIES: erythromycin esterase family protein [Streptomyces]|uniref:Erythromycin esterase n=2 Tax=Streptomyces TaxID=1883 RepID=A0A2N8P8P6_STRNR|nr:MULTISPECIES: erythromycin esterase family protein [Streptomyces]PNE37362.1 erythromycin esterase [Streptomyces noursei]SHM22752.1 erythromycin esterase [Streptomyces yunnanensis]
MTANTDASPASTRLSSEAVHPLRTLDPDGPQDDLAWLDEAIGDARVVAIGENAHYNHESYLLRHRLMRYLVERHGFGAYAMESGFVEGWLTDDWVRGGQGQPGHVMANGITSLMGLWTEMRDHLEWMRGHNLTAARPVGFYGIDLSGSNVSVLPGLDTAIAYLAQADPDFEVDPSIRETAAAFAVPSALSLAQAVAAYGQLAPARRDALTAGLAELTGRMEGRSLHYRGRTTTGAYERTLRALRLAVVIDANARAMARGDRDSLFANRDAAIADTVEWILRREDRIILVAHNGHVQRWPALWPGMTSAAAMGMHLADRIGEDYLAIGITNGTGQTLNTGADFYAGKLFTDLQPPRPGSLDALMAASSDGPFATDLRRLSPADTAAVRANSQQRLGTLYSDVRPLDAYDVVIHLPHVTAAQPDDEAVANSPHDVQEAFSQWKSP